MKCSSCEVKLTNTKIAWAEAKPYCFGCWQDIRKLNRMKRMINQNE